MPNLKKRLTNIAVVYYNKLLYYGKYASKYGFIVPQPVKKCKKNFCKRAEEQLFRRRKKGNDRVGFCRTARKRSE